MKKLLVYLSEYKKESILAPVFKMLEACFELLVPLVVASIVDNGIKYNNTSIILRDSLIMLLLAVVGLVASITAQYFAAKAATGFSANLRSALFKKINSFSFYEVDRIGASTLITRLTSDVNQLQNGVNLVLRLFLRSPIVVFGATLMAFTLNLKAGLLFAVVISVLSVIVFLIMKITVPKYKKVQNSLDDLTLLTRENIAGARVIRGFCGEQNEYAEFSSKNNLLMHSQKKASLISALLNPLTSVVINLGIIALIHSGAVEVNSGVLSQGVVIALYNYMCQILVELIKFANLIVSITKAFASASRVNEIFDVESSLKYENDDKVYDDCAVRFDNVSLNYPSSNEDALNDISFSVKKGEVVGVVGSTGSGKTTLVNLINHFYDVTKGSLTVFGKKVSSYSNKELNGLVKTVMQKPVLFNATVRENIKWGKSDATDEEIDNALRVAQIYDTVYSRGGLDTKLSQNATNFSGGQKQRLTIARAIVSKPQILILDDSTSALDYLTESNLISSIYNLSYKPTIFIVAQRCSSVLNADKIIVLDEGKCVGIGTNEELLKDNEVYREIYYSQFEKEGKDE